MGKVDEFVTEKKLDNNLAHLHQDARNLTANAKDYGAQKLEKVQKKASDVYAQAKGSSQDAMKDMKVRLNEMESQVSEYVREKPGTSLAIAAGVGFLAALLMRR